MHFCVKCRPLKVGLANKGHVNNFLNFFNTGNKKGTSTYFVGVNKAG